MKGLRRRTNNPRKSPTAANSDNQSTSSSSSYSAPLARKQQVKKNTKSMFLSKIWKGSYNRVETDPQEVLGGCPQCRTGDCVMSFVAQTPHLCFVPVPCCWGVTRTERVLCLQCSLVFDSPEEYRQVCRQRDTESDNEIEREYEGDVDMMEVVSLQENASIRTGDNEVYDKETLPLSIASTPPTEEQHTEKPEFSKPALPSAPPSPTSVIAGPTEPPQSPPLFTDEYILQELLYKGHFQQAEKAAQSLLNRQTNLTTLCLLDMALNGQGKTQQADRLAQTYILPLAQTGSFPRLVLQNPDFRIEAKQYFRPQHAYYAFHVYYYNHSKPKRTFELQLRPGNLVVLRECGRTMDVVSGGAHPIPTVTKVAQDVMDYLALEECWRVTAADRERTVPVMV